MSGKQEAVNALRPFAEWWSAYGSRLKEPGKAITISIPWADLSRAHEIVAAYDKDAFA